MGAMVWRSDHLHHLQFEGGIDGSAVLRHLAFGPVPEAGWHALHRRRERTMNAIG